MKKFILRVGQLFTNRRVWIAEPGGILMEGVVHESPRMGEFPVFGYHISKKPVPLHMRPRHNLERLVESGHDLEKMVEWRYPVRRLNFSILVGNTLMKMDEATIGEDTRTRIFRKKKHAERYASLDVSKYEHLDSIHD